MGVSKSTMKTNKLVEEICAYTSYTEDQVRVWLKAFPRRGLNFDEFEAAYYTYFNHGQKSNIIDYIFRAFDADSDGTISCTEFFVFFHIVCEGTLEERLELAFRLYDANQDGEVSYQELLHILTIIEKSSARPHSNRTFDENGNAEASIEERVGLMFSHVGKSEKDALNISEFLDCARYEPLVMRPLVRF